MQMTQANMIFIHLGYLLIPPKFVIVELFFGDIYHQNQFFLYWSAPF